MHFFSTGNNSVIGKKPRLKPAIVSSQNSWPSLRAGFFLYKVACALTQGCHLGVSKHAAREICQDVALLHDNHCVKRILHWNRGSGTRWTVIFPRANSNTKIVAAALNLAPGLCPKRESPVPMLHGQCFPFFP